MFNDNSLAIKNIKEVSDNIQNFIKEQVFTKFNRRGAVIGISGGIDSAVVSTLSANALGSDKVLGLIMPERDSNQNSRIYAENLCKKFNIRTQVIDLTPILESYGVYEIRDNIIKRNFPNFDAGCKYRLVIPNDLIRKGGLSIPHLEILDDKNAMHKIKLPFQDYLDLTAATNIKHRTRMTLLYYYSEKNHYLVAGTTNKSEFVQGYYVKYGDGGVDIDPIASLYKTQVYQLANHLDIPNEIIQRKASPDTWSFEVSDEEFFYGIPYKIIDLLWFAKENNISIDDVKKTISLSDEQVSTVFDDQSRKWNNTRHMREMPPRWEGNVILQD